MRKTFIEHLVSHASEDPDIWLLAGDVGFSVIEPFVQAFPDRFVNVGIAEQNMIGIAAGLSSMGKKVFVYSIANFSTMRCMEQIRNDVCYHNHNVKIVTVGAGFAYGSAGYSHFGIEDMGVLRNFSNLVIFSPADNRELEGAFSSILHSQGPAYLRLDKVGNQNIHSEKLNFKLGKGIKVREGNEVCIFAIGSILKVAIEVAKECEKKGISSSVVSIPYLEPFDEALLLEEAKKHQLFISIEEHVSSGLFSKIAETLCKSDIHIPCLPFCIKKIVSLPAGTREDLLKKNGLDRDSISSEVIKTMTDLSFKRIAVAK